VISAARKVAVVTRKQRVLTAYERVATIGDVNKNVKPSKRMRTIEIRSERRSLKASLNQQQFEAFQDSDFEIVDIHDPLHYVPAEVDVIATSDQIAA
jgi:hypothetical protein